MIREWIGDGMVFWRGNSLLVKMIAG